MTYVSLHSGHFALLFGNAYGPLYDLRAGGRSLAESLVLSCPSGFPDKSHNIEIYCVSRVMPKTFAGYLGHQFVGSDAVLISGKLTNRIGRSNVIACAQSLEAAVALKGKLLSIGVDADESVHSQVLACDLLQELQARVQALTDAITSDVRSAALRRVQQSLPELFGARTAT